MALNRFALPALSVVLLAGTTTAALAASGPGSSDVTAAGDQQSTQLISRAVDGGTPNGPSTNAVISNDRRYGRLIAFELDATDIVRGDTNDQKDVFVIQRAGTFGNNGSPWRGRPTQLVSRGLRGQPANGASFGAAVSGDFRNPGRCIAFLSGASNLVSRDTNGRVDAFLVTAPGRAPRRLSPRRQLTTDATAVAVSGDCSRISFTSGGRLYTSVRGGRARRVSTRGAASDPSYATGQAAKLVYAARGGVWLSQNGTSRGRLVARGGRNPAYNDIKRQTVAYEKSFGGRTQIAYRDLGRREKVISARRGTRGNAGSRDPVIGNSGFYVAFESDASNLGTNVSQQQDDQNGRPDSYLYTDVREILLVQSVEEKAQPLPGGGQNPSMSFYANYIVFDSPGPLGAEEGDHQIFMRYLGPV